MCVVLRGSLGEVYLEQVGAVCVVLGPLDEVLMASVGLVLSR